MKKVLISLLLVAMSGFLSCKQDDTESTDLFKSFDRKGMLENIGANVIILSYDAFHHAAVGLNQASKQLAANPTDANLTSAQTAWRAAASAWKKCEVFKLGPVEELGIASSIDFWPTNPAVIKDAIETTATIDNKYVEDKGASAKGIPALEHLLFSRAQGNSHIISQFSTGQYSQKRKEYLVALTENLVAKASLLQTAWKSSGGNYLDTFVKADGNDISSSIGLLVNQVVFLTEVLKNEKIGRPLGMKDDGVIQPNSVEAGESLSSLNHIKDNLQILENTFLGNGTKGNQAGFDDLLNHLNAEFNGQPLSKKIVDQFAVVNAKANAIQMPLQDAVKQSPQAVEDLYMALKQMVVLLKVDMVNNLGVLITYNDNDGD